MGSAFTLLVACGGEVHFSFLKGHGAGDEDAGNDHDVDGDDDDYA